MKRVFHLSHLLDEIGDNRIDLVTFYELSKLDTFIMDNFNNNKDVRKMFDQDIGEFCLDNMKMIKEENKRNHHNWNGSIAIICEEKDNNGETTVKYKIPIIYKKDNKLLPKEECLRKIQEGLKDEKMMLTIYEEKNEMLSQNEIDLIMLYIKYHSKRYLKSAIGFFVNRLKRMNNDELLYTYCRNLMDKFRLNTLTLRTDFGNIDIYSPVIPDKTILTRKPIYPDRMEIERLIKEENYEELYNQFSFDEINLMTDYYRKGRY